MFSLKKAGPANWRARAPYVFLYIDLGGPWARSETTGTGVGPGWPSDGGRFSGKPWQIREGKKKASGPQKKTGDLAPFLGPQGPFLYKK